MTAGPPSDGRSKPVLSNPERISGPHSGPSPVTHRTDDRGMIPCEFRPGTRMQPGLPRTRLVSGRDPSLATGPDSDIAGQQPPLMTPLTGNQARS